MAAASPDDPDAGGHKIMSVLAAACCNLSQVEGSQAKLVEGGAVPVLLKLLDATCRQDVRSFVITTLCFLSSARECLPGLVNGNATAVLIKEADEVVKHPSDTRLAIALRRMAVRTLCNLAHCRDTRAIMAKAGAVGGMVRLCELADPAAGDEKDGDEYGGGGKEDGGHDATSHTQDWRVQGELREACALALWNFSSDADLVTHMQNEGAIPALVTLSKYVERVVGGVVPRWV